MTATPDSKGSALTDEENDAPGSPTGHESQAAIRRRALIHGIGASAVSRAVSVFAPLVTIPIGLQYLGVTAYGAWTAAVALTSFVAFADLGLGAGLMTRLAGALADEAFEEARTLVASAYATVGIVCGLMVAGLLLSTTWVDFGGLVGGESNSPHVNWVVIVTIAIFLINICASLINRIQQAAQQVGLASIWQAAGSVAGVAAALAATAVPGNPILFVALSSGATPVVFALNTVVFFLGRGSRYRPTLRSIRLRTAVSLLGLGSQFLMINILLGLALMLDSLIVSRTWGLEAAPDFAVPARVFAVLATATSVLVAPLWPINVEALRRGDVRWVRSITRRMARVAAGTALALAVVGVWIGPIVFDFWLGGTIVPSRTLLGGLASVFVVQAVASPYFMVQNAAAILRPQLIGFSLLAALLPVKWLVSENFGFQYIPYVTAMGYVIFLWPAMQAGYRMALHQSKCPEEWRRKRDR